MRLLPNTAAALHRMAVNNAIATKPTTVTSVGSAVLLFKGVMPTKAELMDYLKTSITGSSSYFIYPKPLLDARNTDYLGGVATIRPVPVFADTKYVAALSAAAANNILAGASDTRSCYIKADGTPTWFCYLLMGVNELDLSTGLVNTNLGRTVELFVGSVGDENSSADLKIVGGQVFANSSATLDQSKAILLNDLVLKYAQ